MNNTRGWRLIQLATNFPQRPCQQRPCEATDQLLQMDNTRGSQLIQLDTSSSQHPRQQRLNEATGQLYEDETLQQCDTSSEEVLFQEGSSSDSDYVPEESSVIGMENINKPG